MDMCTENSSNYIQYAQDVEQALSKLEASLHNSDDPEKIIEQMLISAATFYDGDWAGIMEADLTIKVWSTLWWYNRKTGGMTPNRFGDLEEGDYLWRWINALTSGMPVIISDVEVIKKESPIEYQFLTHNGVTSMIAVPFWKRPTGFLIVRNPKRYISRSSLLQMLAFVAVSSINEKRLLDHANLVQTPDEIKKDTDIVIHLFGELEIITAKGIIHERMLKSPRVCRMIVYLLLHSKRPASPYEIISDLWPDEDLDKANITVKNLIYKFHQVFSLLSDYRLLESTASGYRINPSLNIITDLQLFEQCWFDAQTTADPASRTCILKKAISIYNQGLIPEYDGEHWFMATMAYYSLRYIGVVTQLLSILDDIRDYVSIVEYANKALKAVPGCGEVYYWLIYAMNRLGMVELAKSELKAARQVLTELDYQDLLERLTWPKNS